MALTVVPRKLNDLTAFRGADGQVLGFHSRNLQVARLSEQAWQAFLPGQAGDSDDLRQAREALRDWEISKNPNVKTERRETGIRALTLNVTQVCNLHCRYCAAGGDGSYGDPIKRMVINDTLPALESFLARVPRGEEFRITFLGGEPLLYPEGIEILASESEKWALENGIRVAFTIVTNGTLLTQANIDLLQKYGMDVTVSLDGPAAVNDLRRPYRGGRGTTDLVEEGLKLMLSHRQGLGQVLLSGVFGSGNLDLVSAYQYYKQFSADWFDFTYDHNEASTAINEQFMQQMALVAKLAYEEGGEKALRRIHTFDRLFANLDQHRQIENYCGAGKSFLMMDARQNLTTCPWLVGDTKEVVGHGASLWLEKLQDLAEPLIEKHGCGDCWARFLCGGGCMFIHRQVTGDKHKADPNYCNRTRFLIETTLSYYEQSREE